MEQPRRQVLLQQLLRHATAGQGCMPALVVCREDLLFAAAAPAAAGGALQLCHSLVKLPPKLAGDDSRMHYGLVGG
jgi:hypothetical protein